MDITAAKKKRQQVPEPQTAPISSTPRKGRKFYSLSYSAVQYTFIHYVTEYDCVSAYGE